MGSLKAKHPPLSSFPLLKGPRWSRSSSLELVTLSSYMAALTLARAALYLDAERVSKNMKLELWSRPSERCLCGRQNTHISARFGLVWPIWSRTRPGTYWIEICNLILSKYLSLLSSINSRNKNSLKKASQSRSF